MSNPEPDARDGRDEHVERHVGRLRVRIDRTLCVGFGDCVTAAPAAFALGADDVVLFVDPESVDPEQLVRACASCPVDALTVWSETGEQLAP
ncbi:MAG: ferredoxin [Gemmatimonadaceae bacterium]